ncbi:MAG: hypothetical protein GX321_06745, partial [Clostridiales bacterium]|nr:hypothetical protein [Clostridiales bacterium]
MAKMKVFELKNFINEKTHGNIESKDILNFLDTKLGIKKTHSSNLEDKEIKAVKEHFIPSAKKTSEAPAPKNVRSASPKEDIGSSQARAQGQTGSRPQGQRPVERRSQSQGRPLGQSGGRVQGQTGSRP